MTLNITKPTVNSDGGTWGTKNNAALDAIVAYINAQPDPTVAAQAVVDALNLGDAATHAAADFALAGDLSNLATIVADKVTAADVTAAIAGLNLSASFAAKADLVGGLIPTAQIPALALGTSVVVANQAAMLALTTTQVQPGDVAVRSDGAGTFMLTATDPTVLGNWRLLNSPADAVSSVNGQTGTVVLSAANVGADASGAATTAQAAAIAAASTDATTKANAAQAAAVQRVNHTGTQSADTLTDGTTNKAFLATERTKLAGIAANAIDKPTAQGIALVQTLIWS